MCDISSLSPSASNYQAKERGAASSISQTPTPSISAHWPREGFHPHVEAVVPSFSHPTCTQSELIKAKATLDKKNKPKTGASASPFFQQLWGAMNK